MNLGIDLGNGYVKFRGQKFASKVKLGGLPSFGEKRAEIHEVSYEGNIYTVGDGKVFTNQNRYFEEYYKISLLTAVALATPNESVIKAKICLGLPGDRFKTMRKEVEEHINKLGVQKINVNNKDYIIEVEKAIVFIEGAYVVKSKETDRVVTIDVGAGTVNIIEWENQVPLNDPKTINGSFYQLYTTIAQYLSMKHNTEIEADYVEKYLGNEEMPIKQKQVDIRDTHIMIKEHIVDLSSKIGNMVKIHQASKIKLLGGGALPTYKYWKEAFGDGVELIDNSQLVNSEIFDIVAKGID